MNTPPLLNHCNLPPWVIASRDFQDDPRPLELGDVRITERRLWQALADLDDPLARGRYFHDYVSVKFSLHAWPDHTAPARASLRHSYLRFLLNWGADSNGHAGAVLKAWVESRFGLRATYHCGCLATDPAARERYAHDRMKGASQTAGLSQQLDLLYTFCQDELRRRHPAARWLTLYRGTHDTAEYVVRSPGAATSPSPTIAAEPLVEFNNLSSFTSDREVAWEFGSSVWEVRVPLPKIVFFHGLLPPEFLQGESEHLVLGGEYRVRPLRY